MKKIMALCLFLIFALGFSLTVSGDFPTYASSVNKGNKANITVTQTFRADDVAK